MQWTDAAIEAAREAMFDADDMGWPDDEATRSVLDTAFKVQSEHETMFVVFADGTHTMPDSSTLRPGMYYLQRLETP